MPRGTFTTALSLTLSLLSSLLSRLIESSLGSVATKFNFFIHNLAQLRFSGLPANDEPILSFSPKTYTLKQEGRILHASIFSFQKRYNPDKHYVSIVVSMFRHLSGCALTARSRLPACPLCADVRGEAPEGRSE